MNIEEKDLNTLPPLTLSMDTHNNGEIYISQMRQQSIKYFAIYIPFKAK